MLVNRVSRKRGGEGKEGEGVYSDGGTVVRGRASSRDGSHTRDSSPVTSRGHNSTFNANERGTVSKFQLDDDVSDGETVGEGEMLHYRLTIYHQRTICR